MPMPPSPLAYANPPEYWYFNGIPLQSPYGAWNIASMGGSRFSIPVLRGQNVSVPYRAGQAQRAKYPDQRTVTLQMWAEGLGGPAGYQGVAGYPITDQRLNFNSDVQALRQLFWSRGGGGSVQGQLQRNWWVLNQAGSQADIAINQNPFMQSGTSGWGVVPASGATIAVVSAPGTNPPSNLAMALTGTSAANQWLKTAAGPYPGGVYGPVQTGVAYTNSSWVYTPVTQTIQQQIAWYTAAGGLISFTTQNNTVQANTWTPISQTATFTGAAAATQAWTGPASYTGTTYITGMMVTPAQGQLVSSSAMAEVAGSMDLNMNGRTSAGFAVDLLLNDPYFYGNSQTVAITTAGGIISGLGEGLVGEGWPSAVNSFTISLSAATTVTNTTTGVGFTFSNSNSPTFPVTIDVLNQTVIDSAGVNQIANLSHTGSRLWMAIQPGSNAITNSGGTATFTWNDCYI